jgi:hypothetical protein
VTKTGEAYYTARDKASMLGAEDIYESGGNIHNAVNTATQKPTIRLGAS